MTTTQTATLRELAAKATPGPWEWWKYGLRQGEKGPYILRDHEDGVAEGATHNADLDYIAAADPTTVGALLEERDRLASDLRTAVGQAEMWYERYWYSEAGLDEAAEELRGQPRFEGMDLDEIKADLIRGTAPPIPTARLRGLRAALSGPQRKESQHDSR